MVWLYPINMMNSSMINKSYLVVNLLAIWMLCQASTTMAHPAGAHQQKSSAEPTIRALDLRQSASLDSILPELAHFRVVFVGERHDSYGQHLAQLDIIKRLHEINPQIAIGMEMFQQPYQSFLDDYVAGSISEKEMLRGTEWYERWRHDYRLYQPVLQFAKEQQIPVIALNMQREITDKVAKSGLDGLSEQAKASLPRTIDKSDAAYEYRLQLIFHQHPPREGREFKHFLEVQLLWDESMAQQVSDYLKANPERQMIVLAGSGHLMYGSGIPNRVKRELGADQVIVLPYGDLPVNPGITDFLIYPAMAKLPPRGLMGVMMEPGEGGVRIEQVVPDGAAAASGLKRGDILQQIDQQQIVNSADLRLEMLGKQPGDTVSLTVLRKRWLLGEKTLEFEVELGGE
jgi:uncharacterized iron-regulated protein